MADEHEHDHPEIRYQGARADDATVARLRELHPALAENLALTTRWGALTEEEKARARETQRAVEAFPVWTPGYHAEDDRCAGCGKPTAPLFEDAFEGGALPYAAFAANVPVHPDAACVAAFARAHPRVSAQQVDRLRREFTKDLARPTASMSMFFRHDVLSHPPFALEDWANSVAQANDGKLDKGTMRDMERLLHWAHRQLFH